MIGASRWLLALTFLSPCWVYATTLPQLRLRELYDAADLVAVVSVVKKNPIGDPEQGCGVVHTARVHTLIKGTEPMPPTIQFGPYAGREVGKKYLVFLTTKGRRFDPKLSTNSFLEATEASREAACGSAWPPYHESFEGIGTLAIDRATPFGEADAVMVPERWVATPDDLERKTVTEPPGAIPSPWWWLRVDDVVGYLRRHGRQSPNRPVQPDADSDRGERKTVLLSFTDAICPGWEIPRGSAYIQFALQFEGRIRYLRTLPRVFDSAHATDCDSFTKESGSGFVFGEQVTLYGGQNPNRIRRENGRTYIIEAASAGRIYHPLHPDMRRSGYENLRGMLVTHPNLAIAECRLLADADERSLCLFNHAGFQRDERICAELRGYAPSFGAGTPTDRQTLCREWVEHLKTGIANE